MPPLPHIPMIVERGYLDHWKTNLLRQLTGLPNAAELPLRLWDYCESQRDDFIMDDAKGFVIAGICRAQIEPKKLLAALLQCRWLEKTSGGFIVRGWREKNAAWLAKIRGGKERAEKAKREKKGKFESANSPASSPDAATQHTASTQLAGSSNAEAGASAGAVEWSGVENSSPKTPPPRESAQREENSPQILAETTRHLLQLFGSAKKRALGREAEGELARQIAALPLSAEAWEVLGWWLGLPEDERDPYLRAGSRPKDADRLAIRLFSELDRAADHAKKTGRAKKEPGDPEDWKKWWTQHYPDKPCPTSFAAMPEYLRDDCRRDLKGDA
jgi:hypothetical protein